tara:strand:- start:678 stop:1064 length:387 start_codon:yes stop_codon:yes gene_type:complete
MKRFKSNLRVIFTLAVGWVFFYFGLWAVTGNSELLSHTEQELIWVGEVGRFLLFHAIGTMPLGLAVALSMGGLAEYGRVSGQDIGHKMNHWPDNESITEFLGVTFIMGIICFICGLVLGWWMGVPPPR